MVIDSVLPITRADVAATRRFIRQWGSRVDVDDIAQEVLLVFASKRVVHQGDGSAQQTREAVLREIAIRACLGRLARAKAQKRRPPGGLVYVGVDLRLFDQELTVSSLEDDRLRDLQRMRKVISELDEPSRAVLELVVTGQTIVEMAASLGVPEGTIASRVRAAIARARKRLSRWEAREGRQRGEAGQSAERRRAE